MAMKLSDIQGELSLRRIAHADCFDRISLEDRLREGRALGAAGQGTKTASGGVVGRDVGGQQGREASSNVMSGVMPPITTKPSSGRQSAAEQNIFAQSTRGARINSGQSPGRQSPAQNPFAQRGNRGSGHQPGARNAPASHNSSSSFRDNPAGIGFGAANSYTGQGSGRTGMSNMGGTVTGGGGAGASSVAGGGGGDGVSLGNKKTSYGDFGDSIGMGGTGSGNDGNRNARGGGGSSSGGSNAAFRSGGGGISSAFPSAGGAGAASTLGGVSIKGSSDIFSSMGFVGAPGGGSTQVFSGAGGGTAPTPARAPPRPPPTRPHEPPPPTAQPQLDFLTQTSTAPGEDAYDSYPESPPVSYDAAPSYDNHYDDANAHAPEYDYDVSGPTLSQQYEDQGLDMFSGGQSGFGSVQGDVKSAGDFSGRGTVEQVGYEGTGVVGSTGAVMGGDFGGGGAAGVGDTAGGPVRRGARYSALMEDEDDC